MSGRARNKEPERRAYLGRDDEQAGLGALEDVDERV